MRTVVLFTALSLTAAVQPDDPAAGGEARRSVKSGGRTRTYLVHVPKGLDPKAPTPVVVAFHGAAMTGKMMRALTGLDLVADRHKFVVAYPDGTGLVQTWNSGGIPAAAASRADDAAFALDLLDDLKGVAAVDPKRVYAAGFSNGGMMAYKLANDHADRFAAVAAVAGTMTFDNPTPKRPVPVIHFHGTEDFLVRYKGNGGNGPSPKSVDATATAWAKADGCPPDPADADEPDRDPADDCRVKRRTYGPGTDGAEVVVFTVEGGGHTWPGRPLLFGGLAGRTTKDIDASILMWEFFRRHARK